MYTFLLFTTTNFMRLQRNDDWCKIVIIIPACFVPLCEVDSYKVHVIVL